MHQNPIPLAIQETRAWFEDPWTIDPAVDVAARVLRPDMIAAFYARNRKTRIELPWDKGHYCVIRRDRTLIGQNSMGREFGSARRDLNDQLAPLQQRFIWGLQLKEKNAGMAVFLRPNSVISLQDRSRRHPGGCGHVFFPARIGGHEALEELERIVVDFSRFFRIAADGK